MFETSFNVAFFDIELSARRNSRSPVNDHYLDGECSVSFARHVTSAPDDT